MPFDCTQKPTNAAIATRPCLISAWRSQPMVAELPWSQKLAPERPSGSQNLRRRASRRSDSSAWDWCGAAWHAPHRDLLGFGERFEVLDRLTLGAGRHLHLGHRRCAHRGDAGVRDRERREREH